MLRFFAVTPLLRTVRAITLTVGAVGLAVTTAVSQQIVPQAESPLTFRQDGGRSVAVVARSLFENDFVVQAEVFAARPAAESEAARGPAPAVGTGLASGALQLRHVGDSVLLSEYSGTVGGQLQYRRRAAMPVLEITPERAVVVDAEPFWAALGSRVGHHHLAAGMMVPSPEEALADGGHGDRVVLPSLKTTMVAQPVDGYEVTYQVSVLPLPKIPMRGRFEDPRISYSAVKAARRPRWRAVQVGDCRVMRVYG